MGSKASRVLILDNLKDTPYHEAVKADTILVKEGEKFRVYKHPLGLGWLISADEIPEYFH